MDAKVLNYRVNIESDSYADGKSCYMATCPTLNITDSGDTIEDALEHIKEAIELNIKVLVADNKPVPVDKTDTITTNLSIKDTFGQNFHFA